MQHLPVPVTIQSHGRLLHLSPPVVMGILNATPDSFYNKGHDSNVAGLLKNAEKMLHDGAAILDVGGSSTRPGQKLMNADDELKRIIPAVNAIIKHFPEVWLSVDTYHSVVARQVVEAGASIINDISGGRFDDRMLSTVAALKVPYIGMHIQGTPETMQIAPHYNNVVVEVMDELRSLNDHCREEGIKDVILDPGFGFGKDVLHNFELLRSLNIFRILGRPILVGLSRKSMICKVLKVNPEHALNGTTALHSIAILQGANIIRAHDVKEAVEVVQLCNKYH